MSDHIETKKQALKPTPKPPGEDPVLRARPVQGKVDHEALTREIIAKFPKIMAALAK
jgi:hypothetical protein